VGANFPHVQNHIRSFFRFGGPLGNYTSTDDRVDAQNAEFDSWFVGFSAYLYSLVNATSSMLNISFRGGPFKIYEQEWQFYKNEINLSFPDSNTDLMRYSLFKDNAKRIEYLSSLKPGSIPTAMFNPYMHLTNKEFFALVFALSVDEPKPPYSTFLMWNIQPDMTDYIYPP
jgi:hypothetical protein